MNDGVALCVEVDPSRIERRIKHRYLDVGVEDVEEALRLATDARDRREGLSIGILGNAADIVPRLGGDGRADRHRHRPDERARPARPTSRRACRSPTRRTCASPTRPSTRCARAPRWRRTARAWSRSSTRARRSSTTATTCAPRPSTGGSRGAFAYPGFVPAYIRPLFCEGKGPFRWAALVGRSGRHRGDRPRRARGVPGQRAARALDPDGRRAGRVPGAAGADLLARLRRARPDGRAVQRAGGERRGVRRRS